jgi:hypothetical protein
MKIRDQKHDGIVDEDQGSKVSAGLLGLERLVDSVYVLFPSGQRDQGCHLRVTMCQEAPRLPENKRHFLTVEMYLFWGTNVLSLRSSHNKVQRAYHGP